MRWRRMSRHFHVNENGAFDPQGDGKTEIFNYVLEGN